MPFEKLPVIKLSKDMIDSIAPLLGEGSGLQFREGAEIPDDFQAGVDTQAQQEQAIAEVQSVGGSSLMREVSNYFNGSSMDDSTKKFLEEIAKGLGISYQELLELLG